MKLENKSVSQLKKQLDKVFSEFIRRRDKGVCFTCGNKKRWQDQQCGHFVSRSKNNTRFSETNCNCQCSRCNIFLGGNMVSYAEALEKKYGYGIIQKLRKEGSVIKQFKKQELINKIVWYTHQINKYD